MKILFDEGVTARLIPYLSPPHQIDRAQRVGLAGKKNGVLLAAAQSVYDVVVTCDSNIPSQNQMRQFAVGLVVIRTFKNTLTDILPLLPQLEQALSLVQHGQAFGVYANERLLALDIKRGKIYDRSFDRQP